MLKTERDTRSMERKVRSAFRASRYFSGGFHAVFEHGQWWISCDDGAQYSVVDADGGDAVGGFDFEEVSPAREVCEWK